MGPPAAEKENPPFFIVKDAVECDGLITNKPGRGISVRKEPTKVIQAAGRKKLTLPRGPSALWLCSTLDELVLAGVRMNPSRGKVVDLPSRFSPSVVERPR